MRLFFEKTQVINSGFRSRCRHRPAALLFPAEKSGHEERVNLLLFDVSLGHFVIRLSIAVPRPSVSQTGNRLDP
jgi:hypothetical protein